MSRPQLTQGAIQMLMSGRKIDKPVLQIMDVKELQSKKSGKRYHCQLSDGIMSTPTAILTLSLNSLIEENTIQKYDFVRLDNYSITSFDSKKEGKSDTYRHIIILLAVSHVHRNAAPFGNPQTYSESAVESHPVATSTPPPEPRNIQSASTSTTPIKQEPQSQDSPLSRDFQTPSPFSTPAKREPESPVRTPPATPRKRTFDATQGSSERRCVFPIASLSPYSGKWTVRARVISKSTVSSYSNSRGEGKLFSVNLQDESGEIRACLWNEQCDKFAHLFEVNEAYYISNGYIKSADKKFNISNNEYEMRFNDRTTVERCFDQLHSLPSIRYNFVPIREIENKSAGAIIDVIGMCKSSSDLQTYIARATNREGKKRVLKLMDESRAEIDLTLWDADADKFQDNSNPVVSVKGVKVTDFGGHSLSFLSSSVMQVNPDIRECHRLRGWFNEHGEYATVQNLTQTPTRGSFLASSAAWKSLVDVKLENLGVGDTADYFNMKGAVVMFKPDSALYKACPSDNCNKKVEELSSGDYRCNKCARVTDTFKWRMLLQMSVADFSGNQWMTAFAESGASILGKDAEELGRMKEQNPDEFHAVFEDATFQELALRVRCKMETFNDERRLKMTVLTASPVDYIDYSKRLIADIKRMQS